MLAPPCGESKILSLVKTSRKDSKLRGLTRLSYSLDLRKEDMKTGDYPTLRKVFNLLLIGWYALPIRVSQGRKLE